jgi:hypothetical protein
MVRQGSSELLDQKKQAIFKWLRGPSEINWDNLNNIRQGASRYLRYKKRDYLKDKNIECARNSKNKILETCIEE